ncbi:MAG TPA: DMT family transporter [Ginsengibacter sp.]|nr:DMT family transporter [Ginsengibacter sp.]
MFDVRCKKYDVIQKQWEWNQVFLQHYTSNIVHRAYFWLMKKAFLQLHIAVVLAGFTAILGKLINLNEGILVWYRMLFSAAALGLILFFRKEFTSLSLTNTIKLFGVGAIVALHWVSFYGSIKYSNVSVSVTCLSAIGFFTSFLEPIIMRRRIDIVEVLLGMLAIIGIYLIFNFYPEYKTGIIFGIISALFACLFPIFNKSLLREFSAKIVTLYEMTGGFIALCFIIPFYLHFFPASYFIPTAADFFWLLILSLFCTVFAFILSLNALKYISAFTVNLTYNFEPVYSIILAFIIFKENKFLGRGFYFGFGLILLAISLQMARVWKERKLPKKT